MHDVEKNENLMVEIITKLAADGQYQSEGLLKLQRIISAREKNKFFTNEQLLKCYHKQVDLQKIEKNNRLEYFLRTKKVRSLSGIVVVSILTKPYECPGNCLYCPNEKGMPKSYLSNEPAVMRAVLNEFDPYRQVQTRLRALRDTGHPIEKVNIRVIGGTWSFYPKSYQTWFVKKCFQACNDFGINNQEPKNDRSFDRAQDNAVKYRSSGSLEELQAINETAKSKIVEISIETRQDYINIDEIKRLRNLGVTKVELGVQALYDDVLEKNRRGHKIEKTIEATKLLKDAGFKVSYQMMANLPGMDFARDKQMFKELFEDERFKPDYLKIYPLAVVKEAPIYELFLKGEHKPYNEAELKELIKNIKLNVPIYCRIERVIRDIPASSIVEGGTKVSNLRQIIQDEMAKEGIKCSCIRCREIREHFGDGKIVLKRMDYEASGGHEIFLSYETEDNKLLSLLRLRIPSNAVEKKKHYWGSLDGHALVREIHTYGQQIGIDDANESAPQHRGLGKRMIEEAEKIVKEEFGIKKMAIISGVGVRGYFKKLGYRLYDSYMVKGLK